MNRGLNLPSIQRIMNEFEKESATMDMKEEMMSDAVDDVMDDEMEDEEEEGDKILKEVLDEIGVDLSQQVRSLKDIRRCVKCSFSMQLVEAPSSSLAAPIANTKQALAIGESDSHHLPSEPKSGGGGGGGGSGGGLSDEDALQARLDALRRG